MGSADRRPKLVRRGWSVVDRVDRVVIPLLQRIAVPVLRISLGVVFVWFGLLKVFQVSPVSELVARTVYWVDPNIVVPALGALEITIGTLLMFGRALRLALFLLVAQLVGTFLTFIVLPNVTFRDGNPFLLTVEGEFVAKNLVLISAGLVVGTTVRRVDPERRTPA